MCGVAGPAVGRVEVPAPLEGEGVEKAEGAVADRERVDLVAQDLSGPERGVDAAVLAALLVERDPDVLDRVDEFSVEVVLDRGAGHLARVADRGIVDGAGFEPVLPEG